MAIEEVLTARLKAYSGLTALVSTRIYPLPLPQNTTFPAVVYETVSGFEYPAFSSNSGTAERLFQITVWGETTSSVKAVEAQLKGALERWRDSGNGIQDVFLVNQNDLYSDQLQLRASALDFRFLISV